MPHFSWHWPAAGKSLATPVFDNRLSGPGRRWCCRWWWAGWAGASGGWRGRRAGQVAYERWAQGGKRSLAVRSWCCPLHHQATRGNQSAPARSTPLPSSGRAQSEEGCGAWDRPFHSPDEGKQTHRSQKEKNNTNLLLYTHCFYVLYQYLIEKLKRNWFKSPSKSHLST